MEETKVEEDFKFYEVKEANGDTHTLVKAPKSLPSCLSPGDRTPTNDVFNILMADVSSSMHHTWNHVVIGWQDHIKTRLTGRTKIYVFSSGVRFIRADTDLREADFTGGGTDLTSALRTIRQEVEDCSEKYMRVFIVTDGGHNHGNPTPDVEIAQMGVPLGKTIDVYLLGIGLDFPVNYSIDIRSKLHNGSANIPSLYWAKEIEEIWEQMNAIGDELSAGLVTLTLSHKGYVLPGSNNTDLIHLGEWQYYTEAPDKMPKLTLKVDDEQPQPLTMEAEMISLPILLDHVFRQWNSVFIQRHRQKLAVPMETFDLMDSLFKNMLDKEKALISDENTLRTRLAKKHLKTYETGYATLMKQSKTVIGIEGKYLSEMELAEGILKTTVTNRKHDLKNLKMKGHGTDNYMADVEKFRHAYNRVKQSILILDPPTPEECCRITMTSTLQDLQDPDFLDILDENKFDLLKTFTMTGIPVYAPVCDASQINPWTLIIRHILVTPFTILSQRAIESYVEMGGDSGIEDQDIILQEGVETTRFNVIIPTIPAAAANVLKCLVRTNLYSILSTFCILKNPHIIDHNAHIAALGCAWVKSITDHPLGNHPEFIRDRLESLDATANLYMDRESITHYMNVLVTEPKQALMTESTNKYDDRTMKCESLIKPMFYMHLEPKRFSKEQVENVLKLMLAEFIGRCLTHYNKTDDTEATPFTDFFAVESRNPETKKTWLEGNCKKIVEEFKKVQGNLLVTFFTLDDLRAAIKKHVSSGLASLVTNLTEQMTIAVNMKKVEHLRNVGSCGNVKLACFKAWAKEMKVEEDQIVAAFDEKQMYVNVCEGLRFTSSRDRLAREPESYEECIKFIKKKITVENIGSIKATLVKEVKKFAESEWRDLYKKTHSPLVMPLTLQQVVETAQARGVQVTEATFPQVYRYDKKLKLVRNACQIPGCPHYLVPHRNFNQHLSVEREEANFPHALHNVSHDLYDQGVQAVVQEVATCSRQKKTKPTPIEPSTMNHLCDEIKLLLEEYKKDRAKGH